MASPRPTAPSPCAGRDVTALCLNALLTMSVVLRRRGVAEASKDERPGYRTGGRARFEARLRERLSMTG
jgi:hypothetical protein